MDKSGGVSPDEVVIPYCFFCAMDEGSKTIADWPEHDPDVTIAMFVCDDHKKWLEENMDDMIKGEVDE